MDHVQVAAHTQGKFDATPLRPVVQIGIGSLDDSMSENRVDDFVISCDDCVMKHTRTCGECIVSFICDREPGDAVVIDAAKVRALRLLHEAGMVPDLRLQRSS